MNPASPSPWQEEFLVFRMVMKDRRYPRVAHRISPGIMGLLKGPSQPSDNPKKEEEISAIMICSRLPLQTGTDIRNTILVGEESEGNDPLVGVRGASPSKYPR
ncbi:hypothetical protein GWK47_052812 [Chionoecetes opilio]|uniref:Uncharacterized protein n=1 Tax=Chionoecetes opilio TaxID=41210 RepID=A0A8J4Y128_CHIOP|nr:hypothetical protein GWK47_052812 [Chionoecetes opilio]